MTPCPIKDHPDRFCLPVIQYGPDLTKTYTYNTHIRTLCLYCGKPTPWEQVIFPSVEPR